MKRILTALLLFCSWPAFATTWYATSSSVNINATGLWVPTSTGTCTGSGTALVWGAQANGDVFNANGCTALAINVDPGVATGASAGVCGSVTVTPTIESDASAGGAFTYATATNLVCHGNIQGGKVSTLTISGSTNGGTLCGTVTGGATASINAVTDSHTAVTFYVVGNIAGGSATSAVGYNTTGSVPLNIAGNATGGSGIGAHGLDASSGSATITMVGNCVGSNTVIAEGCVTNVTSTLSLTGNIINGLKGNGQFGPMYFTPASTNYIISPKDASYTLGTVNSHATVTPTDPGVNNVRLSTVYGPFTGTLAVAGGTSNGYSY